MKKMIFSSFVAGALVIGLASFTNSASKAHDSHLSKGNIEFKITNNLGSEFKYCVNGGHNYISSGSTKSFSYGVGQDFYYIEGSNCGKQWFEVTSAMHGKEYKLSELTK